MPEKFDIIRHPAGIAVPSWRCLLFLGYFIVLYGKQYHAHYVRNTKFILPVYYST